MVSFQNRIEKINVTDIDKYLQGLTKPCFEIELLKVAFPDMDYLLNDPLELYQTHFTLFNLLYHLQNNYYSKNLYLHIHFMRIFLLPYPQVNRCRHYDPYSGTFCGIVTSEKQNYCPVHLKLIGESQLENVSLKFFYLDETNYERFDEKSARAFQNGAWEILTHYETYHQALKRMDLPASADLDMIKKRFKVLAKKYHPDLNHTHADTQFIEINNAYRFLLERHSAFSIHKE